MGVESLLLFLFDTFPFLFKTPTGGARSTTPNVFVKIFEGSPATDLVPPSLEGIPLPVSTNLSEQGLNVK